MKELILKQITEWRKKRHAAMFEIPFNDKDEARTWQLYFSENGFKGFVTTIGKEISLIFYLIDNPQISKT